MKLTKEQVLQFYLQPFYAGDDSLNTEQRLELIQEELNKEYERRVCLDIFFNNGCVYTPKEQCLKELPAFLYHLQEPQLIEQQKELVGLMLAYRDDYVENAEEIPKNTERFFSIAKKIPEDVLEQLAAAVVGVKDKKLMTAQEKLKSGLQELKKFKEKEPKEEMLDQEKLKHDLHQLKKVEQNTA